MISTTQKTLQICRSALDLFSANQRCCSVFKKYLHSAQNRKPVWEKAVTEAEKIVGYPTSFGNLGWLLNDETTNVAIHLKKLIGSNHPILDTARRLLHDDKKNNQTWGLLVLLISKAAGYPSPKGQVVDTQIFQSQRVLAEVVEMIRIGYIVHQSLYNLAVEVNADTRENLNFGNKLGLLSGDYLLITANGMLSNLRDQHLSELVSSALRDLLDAEFIGDRDLQNVPIPSRPMQNNNITSQLNEDNKIPQIIGYGRKFQPVDTADCIGNPVREWTLRNILGGGSLLGVGCEGALHLAGHHQDLQSVAYLFGCHAALAWHASTDYNIFSIPNSEPFSLVSAPVLFALHEDHSIYDLIDPCKDDMKRMEFKKIRSAVMNTSALDQTSNIFYEHYKIANKFLDEFPESKVKESLKNVLNALKV